MSQLPATAAGHKPYTRLQVRLHWLVVVLVLLQLWTGDAMYGVIRALDQQEPITVMQFLHSSLHSYGGMAIVCLMIWRLRLRAGGVSGVEPQGGWLRRAFSVTDSQLGTEPAWRVMLAHFNHAALYILIMLLGISGALTYYVELPSASTVHRIAGRVFQLLVVLHIVAALYHALILRDGVFQRMWRWKPRSADVRDK